MNEMEDEIEGPRTHHYEFAHRLLPSLLFENPLTLLHLMSDGRALEMLEMIWCDLGEELPPDDRLAADGLALEARRVADGAIIVCTLPAAERTTEARFVGAAVRPRTARATPAEAATTDVDVRVFTLEWHDPGGLGVSEDYRKLVERAGGTLGPRSILCEWTRDGRHLNFGALPAAGVDEFAAAVAARVWGAD